MARSITFVEGENNGIEFYDRSSIQWDSVNPFVVLDAQAQPATASFEAEALLYATLAAQAQSAQADFSLEAQIGLNLSAQAQDAAASFSAEVILSSTLSAKALPATASVLLNQKTSRGIWTLRGDRNPRWDDQSGISSTWNKRGGQGGSWS